MLHRYAARDRGHELACFLTSYLSRTHQHSTNAVPCTYLAANLAREACLSQNAPLVVHHFVASCARCPHLSPVHLTDSPFLEKGPARSPASPAWAIPPTKVGGGSNEPSVGVRGFFGGPPAGTGRRWGRGPRRGGCRASGPCETCTCWLCDSRMTGQGRCISLCGPSEANDMARGRTPPRLPNGRTRPRLRGSFRLMQSQLLRPRF